MPHERSTDPGGRPNAHGSDDPEARRRRQPAYIDHDASIPPTHLRGRPISMRISVKVPEQDACGEPKVVVDHNVCL